MIPGFFFTLFMVLIDILSLETISSSPPSTVSTPRSSQEEDQLDELWFPSSPDTEPPLVEQVENAKIGMSCASNADFSDVLDYRGGTNAQITTDRWHGRFNQAHRSWKNVRSHFYLNIPSFTINQHEFFSTPSDLANKSMSTSS